MAGINEWRNEWMNEVIVRCNFNSSVWFYYSLILVANALSAENTEIQTRLVGQFDAKLPGVKLPTSRQVLSVFFHQHKMLKKSVRDSARFAVRKVLSLWNMAHIPTTIERNAVEKLEQLFDKWIKLKKSSRQVSITQTANEAAFQADTDKLFDIAHADASH